MKKIFTGILLFCMTSTFAKARSWDEPPEIGQLFMIIANASDQEDRESYLIWRYKGSNPSFEEQFKEWHEVTPESLFKLLEDGKDVLTLTASH